MTALQTWRRNEPTTLTGYSITVSVTYSSFDKTEIDELEKKLSSEIGTYTVNKGEEA